jgi:hypothetical protein
MASTSVSASALQSSLDKLTISPEAHDPSILTNPIANATSTSYKDKTDTSESAPPLAKPVQSTSTPSPPPPTPASPTVRTKATASNSPYQTNPPYGMNGSVDGAATGAGRSSTPTGRSSSAADPDKRPEKTTSTAARLIAAGLGQRPPKRTEEERKYDQAMRVQEKKKRDAAKAEEQKKKDDLEKAKKSIWED